MESLVKFKMNPKSTPEAFGRLPRMPHARSREPRASPALGHETPQQVLGPAAEARREAGLQWPAPASTQALVDFVTEALVV